MEIPQEVQEKMTDEERVVGYMTTVFGEKLFFTKMGCGTKSGCQNHLYRSEDDYKRINVQCLDWKTLSRYEKHFVSSFLWN